MSPLTRDHAATMNAAMVSKDKPWKGWLPGNPALLVPILSDVRAYLGQYARLNIWIRRPEFKGVLPELFERAWQDDCSQLISEAGSIPLRLWRIFLTNSATFPVLPNKYLWPFAPDSEVLIRERAIRLIAETERTESIIALADEITFEPMTGDTTALFVDLVKRYGGDHAVFANALRQRPPRREALRLFTKFKWKRPRGSQAVPLYRNHGLTNQAEAKLREEQRKKATSHRERLARSDRSNTRI